MHETVATGFELHIQSSLDSWWKQGERLLLRVVIDGKPEIVEYLSHGVGYLQCKTSLGIQVINTAHISRYRRAYEEHGDKLVIFDGAPQERAYPETPGASYKTALVTEKGQ